jgi:hypothetical protein
MCLSGTLDRVQGQLKGYTDVSNRPLQFWNKELGKHGDIASGVRTRLISGTLASGVRARLEIVHGRWKYAAVDQYLMSDAQHKNTITQPINVM